jgi:hypothetical protein
MKIPKTLIPPLHTFWQAFLAQMLLWWGASGLVGLQAIHHVSDARQYAYALIGAVLAAAASAGKQLAKTYAPKLRPVDQANVADVETALDDAGEIGKHAA